mmetsp:Transcript_5556/g.10441  ORF Transcript_5556/g.10441 Transcript_5556/m.10441 type:complete len:233 (+) Transcript_5556:92-790(+)
MNCGIHLVLAVSLLHQLALRAMCKPQLTEGCDGEGNCEEHQRSLLQPRVIQNNLPHWEGLYHMGQGCCQFDYTGLSQSYRNSPSSCLKSCETGTIMGHNILNHRSIAADFKEGSEQSGDNFICRCYFGWAKQMHTQIHVSGECSACYTFAPPPTPMPMPTLMPTPMPTQVPDCWCTRFLNQFECEDGTKRFCASDEQCEFGKKFKKWKWSPKWPNGCQHTSYFWKKKFPPLP